MIEISLITTITLAFLMGIVVGIVAGYILDESISKKDALQDEKNKQK